MGRVNIADFEAGAFAGQAAGAQGGQTTLVRDAGCQVRLVHELGQLGGAEELLDGRHDGANVHQALRRDLVRLLHAHALADDALHTGHADAELVLDQLADRADAAVAEMVDVVGGVALFAIMQRHDVLHGLHDVFLVQRGAVLLGVEAQLLVDLVAADLCQVVALGVEEQTLDQRAGGIDGGRLARTEATVQLYKGLFLRGGGVAVQRAQHHLGAAQDVDDLLAGLGQAHGTQHQRCGLLALAVDADGQDVALVRLELQPAAAAGDDLRVVNQLVRRAVMLGGEVHTGAADQLGDDDALRAVDDERALRRHHGEIAHEDFLLLDLAGHNVDEADLGIQRSLIALIVLAALLNGHLGLFEVMRAELDVHVLLIALDGADVCQRGSQALRFEPIETIRLDGDQIRNIHDARNLREAPAFPITAVGSHFFLLGHEVVPPSKKSHFCEKTQVARIARPCGPVKKYFFEICLFVAF